MLKRSTDVSFINYVVNHPSVRPFVGGEGELELSGVIARPEHWFLMGEHGGFLLEWSAPGVRQWHTFVLPDGYGKWAADARAEALNYARSNGVRQIWAKIPPAMPHVARFARQGGMKPTDDVIEMFDTPYRIYSVEFG